MTTHRICECHDCGAKYTYQASGPGCREHNKGATMEYCIECGPKHYVPPPPPTHRWVLTDEVTPEQMFEWAKEDWEEKQKLAKENPFYLPMRRSYMGLVELDGSDYQDAIYSHGYKMVYWVNSHEVAAIYKWVPRSRFDVATRGLFHDVWHRLRAKQNHERQERKRPKKEFEFKVQPMSKPSIGILYFDYRYGDNTDEEKE